MGSGKTTLFKKWGQDFGGTHFDFDWALAADLGLEPHQLGQWIETHGWPEFRKRERALLQETLQKGEGLYALGGGAFSPENIELFKNSSAQTLWVKTPVDLCWERVKGDTNRPLVKAGRDAFFSLYQEREPQYSQAKYSISGENPYPELSEFWKNYVI